MNRLFSFLVCLAFFSGCLPTVNRQATLPKARTSQGVMVLVAKRVQACWFGGGDERFNKYRMAAEINSYAGKPRVLIVPKSNPGGLPVLVAQAEGKRDSVRFSSFGPLLTKYSDLGIDLNRWAIGKTSC